jgi:hypothetical protein
VFVGKAEKMRETEGCSTARAEAVNRFLTSDFKRGCISQEGFSFWKHIECRSQCSSQLGILESCQAKSK